MSYFIFFYSFICHFIFYPPYIFIELVSNQGRSISSSFIGLCIVAEVDALTKEEAIKEIQHYAMIYCQDGEVEIIKKWESSQ